MQASVIAFLKEVKNEIIAFLRYYKELEVKRKITSFITEMLD